jgi:hypothetical protein
MLQDMYTVFAAGEVGLVAGRTGQHAERAEYIGYWTNRTGCKTRKIG